MGLGDWASIIAIIGFPLAIIAVLIAYREGRNSRDLASSISISEAFLRYLPVWRGAVELLQPVSTNTATSQQKDLFTGSAIDILNWLNTIGIMIETHLLARPNLVLGPELRTFRQMLDFYIRHTKMLEGFEVSHGAEAWLGVRVLDRTVSKLMSD